MPTHMKNKRGGRSWYAILRAAGLKPKHIKCASKDEALTMEIAHRRSVSLGDLKTSDPTLESLLINYTNAVEGRGISEKSVDEKHTVFAAFGKHIGPERTVRSITYGEVERFLLGIAKDKSGSRANRYRCHIVAAYAWGMKALRLPGPNPWVVEKFKAVKSARQVPTLDEFWKVYEAAAPDPQWQRLLLTLLHTAARINEALCLTWDDVDFANGKVRLWTSKRSGGRECNLLPMTDELAATLKEQRRFVELRSDYVFINGDTQTRYYDLHRGMNALCKRAGVRWFGFHGIRHLSASVLDNAGLPLRVIQGMLRHKNSATTSRYLHELEGVDAKLDGVFNRKAG